MKVRGLWSCALLLGALGCAGIGAHEPSTPLRISNVADEGDARRRASSRLVQEGLTADAHADTRRALGRYERAIQIDPTNPYAYLALARYYIESGEPRRGLQYLDRAERLLDSEGALSPRVEAHLDGLRGGALVALGQSAEGLALLARAQERAPEVWHDGRLTAAELQ